MNKQVVLHQFEFSHFNEKIRWALDFKNIAHKRTSYLPGPHAPAIKKLSGKTQTPVLELDGEIVPGSAAIIARLEADHPAPSLYPADKKARVEALACQDRFDAELGPAARSVIFSELIGEGSYLCAMFARAAAKPKRLLYRASFPLARGMIAKGNGTADPTNVVRSKEIVGQVLDDLARRIETGGYLVGDRFSVADLTAAALLAPLADPKHPDMARPKPVPQPIAALIAHYASHPAIAWVERMYAEHR